MIRIIFLIEVMYIIAENKLYINLVSLNFLMKLYLA